MVKQALRSLLVFLVCVVCMITRLDAQEVFAEKHIEVAMRKIGHEVLLHANDSTARILPILKQDEQYIIQFETEFGFKPAQLVRTVSGVMDDARIADRYILEVEQCLTEAVVYSFEMDNAGYQDIVPCQSRMQPRSCYRLVLTLLDHRPICWQIKALNRFRSIL